MTLALGRCLSGDPAIPVERLVGITDEMAAAGRIENLDGLSGDRVWIFRGARDAVVGAPVVDALEAWYRFVATGDRGRARGLAGGCAYLSNARVGRRLRCDRSALRGSVRL